MSKIEYKLERQIGKGTFGDVYQGIEIQSGMKVAIKRLRKKILYDNGSCLLKAYHREIEIMKKCQCENSIKFFKEYETQNNFNIIMELCDTDLLCYLYERPKPFSSEEIRDCFLQLNNVFKKMNENNIIHRDLKLGNVLIIFTDKSKKKFIPKLSDYGFSKELNSYNYNQYTHLGTPATMAPEIMMNYQYDNKSDLWSIGVMMYQLYYREIPYEGNTEDEILKKINLKIPFKQPEDPKFRDLINKLLVVNPNDRISWNDYFNHPFFTGENLINNNEQNNGFLRNTISFIPNSEKELGGYSFNSRNKEYNFSVQGDIYGNIEAKSTKNLINVCDILAEDDDNLEYKIDLLNRGKGINDREYKAILRACIESQDKDLYPLADKCINRIKNIINGEWFVFVCSEEESNYDFYLSYARDDKYLSFKYKENNFQVIQI